MKKALIYDPYLDTLGGGERYSLTFAQVVCQLGFQTELAWKDKSIISKAENRFGLDLKNLKINPQAFNKLSLKTNLFSRYLFTHQYDLIFYLSDGSLPFLFGKKNLIHFQVPFTKIGGSKIINFFKLNLINKFIYNSEFTRQVLEKKLPENKSFVLYPPVATEEFRPTIEKEKLILSVGRFDSPSHSKRQDILIKAFKKLPKKITSQYKLIFAGGLMDQAQQLDFLKKLAKDFRVEFRVNPNFIELKQLYSRAQIYWHAAGYGVNESQHPEQVEHFGITTVEAMSAGCVPVVINRGGQKEIVTPKCGFLCNSLSDITKFTHQLIDSESAVKILSQNAIIRSRLFNLSHFREKIKTIVI